MSANDMSAAIVPKSTQLNADDLIAGPRTITITRVEVRSQPEQPVSVYFEGDNGRPWMPCKSMCRCMVALWGPDANAYVGRSLTLYNDPKVKWGGVEVGGIRISHASHIDDSRTLSMTVTKGQRKPFVVRKLEVSKSEPVTDAQRTLRAEADKQAGKGVESFRKWWAGLAPKDRDYLKPSIKDLQVLAKEADAAAAAEQGDDPDGDATHVAGPALEGGVAPPPERTADHDEWLAAYDAAAGEAEESKA